MESFRASLPDVRGKLLFDEPMARHTSYKIGGPADIFFQPCDLDELCLLLALARSCSVPVHFVGAGSNLLVSDAGVRGMVVSLGSGFRQVLVAGNVLVAGAAVTLPALVRRALGAGLSGLEGLSGIPGTVGGAVCMNAGTPSGCIRDTLVSVKALDSGGTLLDLSADDLSMTYRSTAVREKGYLILEATFELRPEDPTGLTRIIRTLTAKRKSSQPMGIGTAGSVFKNPSDDFAGRILDECGVKGMQVGGARVSGKHANFIENTGDATADDVYTLICRLKELAASKFGVELEPEIELLGEWVEKD